MEISVKVGSFQFGAFPDNSLSTSYVIIEKGK